MPPESEKLNFIIDVEEDGVKAGVLRYLHAGIIPFSGIEAGMIIPTDLILTENEVSDSYFYAELSTIQPLDVNRSILILVVRCHPAIGRRFMNVKITWKVEAPNHGHDLQSGQLIKPAVRYLAPEYSVGGWTEEGTKFVWGAALPLEVGVEGCSIGVNVSGNEEIQKVVTHAMIITGTKRDLNSRCVWTVEENSSSARGIPSHFQFAIVVEHQGPFETELDLKAKIGGGWWPTSVKAKKGKGVRSLTRTVDVETWKCGEVLWEPGEEGWKRFMQGVSGAVPGSVVTFSELVIRS